MLHIVFHTPEIPGNSGNAIRLAACTGARLHLVEPLGFTFADAHLKRAGLDYHDLAVLEVHPSIDHVWQALDGHRVFAFTGQASTRHTDIQYQDGDVLLFGRESTGLPDDVLHDPHVSERVRIPMLPGRRSLNLANSASIAMYEAWRQLGFPDGV